MFHHIIHKVLESKFQSNIKYTCQRIIRAGALTRFRVSPFESSNSNQIISIYIQPAIIHLQFLHEREIESLHTGSTGQTELPKERVKALELHLPDNGTLDRFNTLIAPMAAAIVSKQNENNKLATLRDALLPKLMSGEIDVSAVQL